MEAIILAGGLGTRLASRLNQIPKSMAPVAGRPFLEILLDKLVDAGCSHIILSVGHLRDVILQRLGNHYRGVRIDYAIEESPLGTGGAIRLALGHAHEPSVLVLNGDTYLESDLATLVESHKSSRRPLTMAVVRVDDTARYGGVLIEDRLRFRLDQRRPLCHRQELSLACRPAGALFIRNRRARSVPLRNPTGSVLLRRVFPRHWHPCRLGPRASGA
jgi:NDP-sugar pyrophosphorylase family protein